MATIRIRGNVLGTPESLSTLYPVEAGPLRLSEKRMAAGEVTYGKTRHFFLTATTRHSRHDPSLLGLRRSVAQRVVIIRSRWSGRHRDSQFLFQLTPENRDGTLGNPGANHFRQQTGAPETEVLFTADLHPDFSSMTPEEVNDARDVMRHPTG